jgi:hypothetical protein
MPSSRVVPSGPARRSRRLVSPRLCSATTSPSGGTRRSQETVIECRPAASMIRSGGSPSVVSASRSRIPCDNRSTSPTTAHHCRRTAWVICASSVPTSSRLTEVAVRHQRKCTQAAERTMPPTTMAATAVRRPILRPGNRRIGSRLSCSRRVLQNGGRVQHGPRGLMTWDQPTSRHDGYGLISLPWARDRLGPAPHGTRRRSRRAVSARLPRAGRA